MRQKGGFTIVETMLVLGIATALFLVAIRMFSGSQNRQQFALAMREIQTIFEDVINDVSTGYYGSPGFGCTAGSGAPPTLSTAVSEQGTKIGCIFVGKAILLPNGTSATSIELLPVVGNRQASGVNVNSYAQAFPTTVYNSGLGIDIYKAFPFKFAVKVKSAVVGAANTYAAGYYAKLGSNAAGSGKLDIEFHAHNSTVPTTRSTLYTCIRTSTCFGASPTTSNWVICFDGQNGQTARITLGGGTSGGSKLTTKLEFVSC